MVQTMLPKPHPKSLSRGEGLELRNFITLSFGEGRVRQLFQTFLPKNSLI
jgi:hypothetical protein